MQPTLVHSSTDRRVHFEESAGGTRVELDFRSMAEVIDTIAGYNPQRLPTQLAIILDSGFKEEGKYCLTAALVCRDPLSDLGTICTDALKTLADLKRLADKRGWPSLVSALGHSNAHACALLNACEDRINTLSSTRAAAYEAIRQRLEQAAALERTARSADIQAIHGLRVARCPNLWQLFERYRDANQ